MKRGCIVIVNYNQEREIGRFLAALRAQNVGLPAFVVDDGSSDGSAEIAEQNGFQVLRHGRNLGIGAAIRTGIEHARRELGVQFVVIMSSNGKMRPAEIGRVAGPVERGEADYVQGSRFLAEGASESLTPFRRIAIPAFSITTSVLFHRRFTDITCGFRAYTLDWLERPEINLNQEWLERYELEYYIHYWAVRSGIRIVEVPVTIDYSHLEAGRKSKIKPLTGWWSMIRPFVFLFTGLKK